MLDVIERPVMAVPKVDTEVPFKSYVVLLFFVPLTVKLVMVTPDAIVKVIVATFFSVFPCTVIFEPELYATWCPPAPAIAVTAVPSAIKKNEPAEPVGLLAVDIVAFAAHAVTEQRRVVSKVNKIFLIMIMVFGYCSRVKSIKTSHARTQKCPSVIKKCVKIRL
ncbi:MAG: hypothetical protein IJR32_01230 [Paludibacteraceae bacterium]|nr:hypothetical protein [Paludibacteraceae bacterium]